MQVLARIPTLPAAARGAAPPAVDPSPPFPVVSTSPPAPRAHARRRPAPSRSVIPDWSIAALAAVAIAVWSLAAWRDAGDGRPDRIAVESPASSDPAAARTR